MLGGGVYLDFRNNDARLVIENIKRANRDGALIASHVKAEDFLLDDNGKIIGVKARDLLSDQEIIIKAKLVINTTGPWVMRFVNSLIRDDRFIKCALQKGCIW